MKLLKGKSKYANNGLIQNNAIPLGTIKKGTNYSYVRTENGWEYESRVVVEKSFGRKLKRTELVHHIDTIKFNNDIKNLQVCTHSKHAKIHAKMRHIKLYGCDHDCDSCIVYGWCISH